MVHMVIRLIFIALSCVFMYTTTNQVLSGKLNLAAGGLNRFNNLKTFTDKLHFASLYWSASVLLAIGQVVLTIFARLTTSAIDPSPENDKHVFKANSILRNYMEQFIISIFSQISLLGTISAKQTAQFIPLMNLYFVVGRVLFQIGYPKFRSFGFICCLAPSLIACSISTYELLVYVQLVN